MLVSAYITFASVLVATREAFAQNGIAVKKTQFPYMAFIFYSDETIVDETGARFLHGAVLIKLDLLLSAAVDPMGPTGTGFPMKTLLARMGAISIDLKFTLNEDEEEQEREVVKVIRPSNHEASQSWRTDITLLKTLLPFNTTLAVAPVSLHFKHTYTEKSCTILALMPGQEDKTLTSLSVEMLPKCGEGIDEKTMACATDGEENKLAMSNPEFCIGNSGGPLICEGEVMGLQTYIDSNCSLPYFYQRISGWETFITCGSEDKCNDKQCSGICAVTNKDTEINKTPESSITVPAISSSTETMTISVSSTTETMTTSISSTTETMTINTTDNAIQNILAEAVSEIIKYENIPTVDLAAVHKELANVRKIFDENVNIEFIPVGETSTDSTTPKAIEKTIVTELVSSSPEAINKTIVTELVTSSSKPTLVFETTANIEEHTTESKKEGPPLHMTSVEVSEKSSTVEPETDSRKAIVEALGWELEAMQGKEPQPVPTHIVYRASGTSIWQNLCYKVAIVLTLLVIAM